MKYRRNVLNRVFNKIINVTIPYAIRNSILECSHSRKFDKEFYKEIKKNKVLKDSHKGERCFIFGNGPSLSKIDFKKFENEFTFTMNQLTRNERFYELNTNFHFWSDERFFHLDLNNPEDKELYNIILKVNNESKKTSVFFDITASELIREHNLGEIMDIHFFDCDGATKNNGYKQNIDVSTPIPNMPTTVFYAIWFAVYMGFNRIYLLGCDCSGFISTAYSKINSAEKSLYAYNISENEKIRMEKIAKQTSLRNELQSYVYLFDNYVYMNKYCSLRGVSLINCTPGGLLEELPRININDVIPNTLISE